jgi:hypothetical protein
MAKDHRAALKGIRTFPQLVRFLRDEMDWPIETGDFDVLTFEYTAEELGIDAKNAAKIEEIKRLRPLSAGQPWGVFFVKFEPKRLPVVALRRILSQVVLKKRATGKAAERAAWAVDDLLFVSSYGEGDDRRMCLAHFTEDKGMGDLAALNVLGWDGQDTGLHLDDVADKLTRDLAWPKDEGDKDAWREQWRSAFELRHREVITTSRALAIRLAELARSIRVKVNAALAIESEHGKLRKLMKAFQEALIHDLNEDSFADMYAQTIAYGLLSARVSRQSGALVADDAALIIPVTNPFLKELMETFLHIGGRKRDADGAALDFDELGINGVVETLREANMEAVLRDFGDKNPQEDPVIHFYEDFLAAYDKEMKVQRGVFYTPRPVVAYIVRSVDDLLRTEFGLEDGLADTSTWGQMAKRHNDLKIPQGISPDQAFVQILDPACGTGTFLVEVIDLIHKKLAAKWRAQGHDEQTIGAQWNDYVPRHLLPRLHGYELLMAPYAIAHLKLGLKLFETRYWFRSDERARIYLTNSLEPAGDRQLRLDFLPALAHEAHSVNEIKRKQRFTVVVGNPPYSVVSRNAGAWITSLTKLYKEDVREERNIQPLSDDYIKFLRLGHFLVELAGAGVLSMITNHTYLTGVIHRGMRQRLLATFDAINVLDLHGSRLLGLTTPNGDVDENVFDIQQGVSIALFVRLGAQRASARLRRADLWGSRSHKYAALSGQVALPRFEGIDTRSPLFLFVASTSADEVYSRGFSVTDLFELSSAGFVTGRDEALIAFEREPIETLVGDLARLQISDRGIASRYSIENTSGWPVSRRRRDVARDADRHRKIIRAAYRPFDERFTFYSDFLQRCRYSVFRHLLADNVALITSRLVKGEEPAHFFVSRIPVEKIFLSPKTSNNAFVFPLYRYPEVGQMKGNEARRPAISAHYGGVISAALGLRWLSELERGTPRQGALSPEAVLGYAYGVFFSPTYRARYAEFLRTDFPRVPLPGSLDLFSDLVRLGSHLVALHLMEAPKLDRFITTYAGPKEPEVVRVGWSDDTVWLDAASTKKGEPAKPGTIGFHGVPEVVWNFHIGGYQVCEKWLKDRKGRKLLKDDILHYQKIVVALNETIRLMKEIDEVIEAHGGWPDAFAAGEKAKAVLDTKVVAFPAPEEIRGAERQPLRKAAEGKGKYRAGPKSKGKKK